EQIGRGKGLHNLPQDAGSLPKPTTASIANGAAPAAPAPGAGKGDRTGASRSGANTSGANPADRLSATLRQAYQSTVEETVPDSIMDLLRQLD
ncbi:MAG: NepR family anti-sigma factor, partial [Sphingopyxis sp.]